MQCIDSASSFFSRRFIGKCWRFGYRMNKCAGFEIQSGSKGTNAADRKSGRTSGSGANTNPSVHGGRNERGDAIRQKIAGNRQRSSVWTQQPVARSRQRRPALQSQAVVAHEVRGFPRYAMLPQVRRRPAYDEMKRSDLADDHGPVRHLAGTYAHIVGVCEAISVLCLWSQIPFPGNGDPRRQRLVRL